MMRRPAQPVTELPNSGTVFPTTTDSVFRIETRVLVDNRENLVVAGVMLQDLDPLSPRELSDLMAAEAEIREGRFTEIGESASDEDVFRFLDSD